MTVLLCGIWIAAFWGIYGVAHMCVASDGERAAEVVSAAVEQRDLEAARARLAAEREAWYAGFSQFRRAEGAERAYDVWLTGRAEEGSGDARLPGLLRVLPDVEPTDALEPQRLLERVAHIGPETVALALPQEEAIRLKVALESVGARVRIEKAESA